MPLTPDPEVWFVESVHGMVTKTSEETIVPCVVTNPNISVTLFEKDTDTIINGVYVPGEGYKAPLEDRTYFCAGQLNGEEKHSQVFYIFSIVGKCSCSFVLRPGSVITSNFRQRSQQAPKLLKSIS